MVGIQNQLVYSEANYQLTKIRQGASPPPRLPAKYNVHMAHARPAFWFHSYYRSLRTMSTYHPDSVGAFMNRVSIPGAIDGPLSGKTFCVKDVFDVSAV